jgi:hypothetical protein
MAFNNCEGLLPNYYEIDYSNNTDYDVYVYVRDNRGEQLNNTYPDTTISFNKGNLSIIKAISYIKINIGTLPIEKYFSNMPSDTLSVFYFHADTLDKYLWEDIQHDYKILRRYDLSVEDFIKLKNDYDVPEIPYPPNERMKDMKMYPPYGQ